MPHARPEQEAKACSGADDGDHSAHLMNKNAVVTGAGSGVGQAVALALVKQGWRVAIVGRRAESLQETITRAGADNDKLFPCPCDIGKSDAVAKLGREVLAKFGTVEVLVNAAGTNAPKRAGTSRWTPTRRACS